MNLIKKTTFIFLINLLVFNNNFAQEPNYSILISNIKKERDSLKKNKISIDSCKKYILDKFYYKIFPKWIGTKWDYNGYTKTPKKGSIACGYFVSTSLKQMGFNWNRYKLAQMYSKQIIEKTCDTALVFRNKFKLNTYMKKQPNGIYILGLSNHVGFIIKVKNNIWFIHSNYIDNKGPCKEKITNSNAINYSNVFWVGKFLTKNNIKKWLNNKPYTF